MSEKMISMFEANNRMRRAQEAALEEQERRERREKLMHHRMVMWCLNVGTGSMAAVSGINFAVGNTTMAIIGSTLVAIAGVASWVLDKRYAEEVL